MEKQWSFPLEMFLDISSRIKMHSTWFSSCFRCNIAHIWQIHSAAGHVKHCLNTHCNHNMHLQCLPSLFLPLILQQTQHYVMDAEFADHKVNYIRSRRVSLCCCMCVFMCDSLQVKLNVVFAIYSYCRVICFKLAVNWFHSQQEEKLSFRVHLKRRSGYCDKCSVLLHHTWQRKGRPVEDF